MAKTPTTDTTPAAATVIIDGARLRPWPPFARRGNVEAWHVLVPADMADAALGAGTLDHVLRRAERVDDDGTVTPALYVDGVSLTGEAHRYANGRTVKYDDDGVGHVRLIVTPREPAKPAKPAPTPRKRGGTTRRSATARRADIDGALA